MSGRSPSGPGSRASHEADSSSPEASIPNAVYAVAPQKGCAPYFTPGRAYEVRDVSGGGFWITNDTGTESFCLWRNCGHLQCGDWERVNASAIEAPSGVETGNTDSTEGESAVPERQTPDV